MRDQTKRLLLQAGAGVGLGLAIRSLIRRRRLVTLRGCNVLITGGSRGLGLILARQAVRDGARVAICARDSVELEEARRDLADRGADVRTVTCDVTHAEQVQSMVDELRQSWGPIDVLINNAGTIEVGPMETMGEADYEKALQTHFWGPFHTIRAVLPDMRRRGGRIVNIASIGGKISIPHLLPYCTSKFALVGFSEGLRAELAGKGVAVTTVCPGLMRTGSPRNVDVKGEHQAEYAMFSIGDSLPGVSMNAERAARQILEACRQGDAEVVLSLPAKIGAAVHGLFPGAVADVLGLLSRCLPGPGADGTRRVRGSESESAWAPSALTVLSDHAAQRNNEIRD